MAGSAGVPVAWNAVGVSSGTPDWARGLLAKVIDAADYVSVRDGASLAELQAVSPTGAARLVPDSAFAIAGVLDALGSMTNPPVESQLDGRPYVIIQPSRGLNAIADVVREAVPALLDAGVAVLEVPISPVLGDEVGLLGDLPSGVIQVEPWPAPAELARLIAGARAVVAHSFHCSVVALAHGVPVFRAASPEGSKYHALANFAGVRQVDPALPLAPALLGAERHPASSDVAEQTSQLVEHWDRIAALVTGSTTRDRAERQLAARRIVSELPALLAGVMSGAADEARIAAEGEHRQLAERHSATLASLAYANERALKLTDRIGALEVDLARERSQAAADRRRAEEELERRRKDLARARSEAKDLQRKAASFDRMRRRRVVRAGVAGLRLGRRAMRTMGFAPAADRSDRPTDRSATAVQAEAMAARLRSTAPGSDRTTGPLVSIIVLNRDGASHLRRLLPAIDGSSYRSFELIVVDNGSSDDSVELLTAATAPPVTLIRNAENESFADANNRAVARAGGELLLFLNNDVEPLGSGWLGRMVDTLEGREADAVGARLVYPRREMADNAGDTRFPT